MTFFTYVKASLRAAALGEPDAGGAHDRVGSALPPSCCQWPRSG
jgi:hypothetical protein